MPMHQGARPFQDLSREHQVLGRGCTKAIARMRGLYERTKRGHGGAMLLGSFGRMWPSSPHGRANAVARAREACGRHKR
ncbi:hypothetical protein PIB30_073628, partial [Stylosanthes scabra]|nr:hypothetical protein [Stylosanthes scabra]